MLDAPAELRLDAPRELSICVWRPELPAPSNAPPPPPLRFEAPAPSPARFDALAPPAPPRFDAPAPPPVPAPPVWRAEVEESPDPPAPPPARSPVRAVGVAPTDRLTCPG